LQGVFASLLDLFIVNVAFPDMQHDFAGSGLAELSWVLNGYAIVFAALLVPAGRLADLYGRRRGFVAGLSLFVLASAACAAAPTAAVLIAARVLQGAGAAILTPSSLGVVLPAFAPHRRLAVIAAWAAVGAVGGLLVAAGIGYNAVRIGLTPDYAGAFLPGQLLTGAGVGLSMPAFTAVAVSAAGPARIATAIGISSMFRQVGAALGVAAFVALVATPTRDEAIAAYRHGWVFMIAAATIGATLMLAARLTKPPAPTHRVPAPVDRQELPTPQP